MARFCPLFSGSKGNCIVIGGADSFVLVDAGVSAKRIADAIRERGLDISRLAGILVTHEHKDHINGIRVLASKYHLRIFSNVETLTQLDEQGHLAGTAGGTEVSMEGMELCGMKITPFATSHDTVRSWGYAIETADGRKVAVATDTGCVTDSMHAAVTGCDLVYIESNHDVGMLMNGSYDLWLKQRVMSSKGHLSNDACAVELQYLVTTGSTRFVLGHLSQENNRPEVARSTAHAAFDALHLREGVDYTLSVTPPCGSPLTIF